MKKKIALTALIMLIVLSLTGGVQAYQSTSKGTSKQEQVDVWITKIRKMEEQGAGLGLSEAIDEETLLSTSKSNDIDVHLLKNTEYGAILLLGASEYGKQGSDLSDTGTTTRRMDVGNTNFANPYQASTTGNNYGIYEMGYFSMNTSNGRGRNGGNNESVAGGGPSFLNTTISARYIDRYNYQKEEGKVGDATTETKEWHKSGATWINSASYGFLRGYNGAFYYDGNSISNTDSYARAGVVVGKGF